ncbi:MAG: hypothetical protein PHX61_01065 [Alphaproteobacteria bacterium]|nr:hypothetical protein [Alphaproteobacteria bacterium]
MPDKPNWLKCLLPAVGDTLKWNEPLWAEPSKPRGKPDKIGEQQVIAKVLSIHEIIELEVINVEKISPAPAPVKVKIGDIIRRKKPSIALGNPHKLAN